MTRRGTVSIPLPGEFAELCERDGVDPAEVLRGFIADLCELRTKEFNTGGSDERMLADRYYERRWYPYRRGYR